MSRLHKYNMILLGTSLVALLTQAIAGITYGFKPDGFTTVLATMLVLSLGGCLVGTDE